MNWFLGAILIVLIWNIDGGTINKHIMKKGTGPKPQAGQKVSVHYNGTLKSDGTQFDSSVARNKPFQFTLMAQEVITGWDYGVASMKLGETAQFEIPPQYAYGAAGYPPDIPPNATLIFEIELLAIQPALAVPGAAVGAAPGAAPGASQQGSQQTG